MQYPASSFGSGDSEKGAPPPAGGPTPPMVAPGQAPESVPLSIAADDPAQMAADLLGEGFWSFRAATGQLTLSRRWKQSLGYLDAEVQPSLAGWLEMVHPADQDRLRKSLLTDRKPFSIELRALKRDGLYAQCLVRGWVDGEDPERLIGTLARVDAGGSVTEPETRQLLTEAIEAGVEAMLVLRAARNSLGEVADFEVVDLNTKGAQMLGVSRGEAVGRLLGEVAPDARENGLAERYAAVMASGSIVDEEFHANPGGFQRVWVRQRVVPLSDGVAVFAADVSNSRRSSDASDRSRRMFERITTTTPDLHAIWDIETRRFVYSNRNLLEMLGYETDREAIVHLSGIERILHPEDLATFHRHLQTLSVKETSEPEEAPFRFRSADGTYRWFYFRDDVFERHATGRPRTILCTAQEITRQKRHEVELQERNEELILARREMERRHRELEEMNLRLDALAATDGVTGVKNHRAFQERLLEEVERAQRYNLRLALVLADLDHFKQYNDRFGHPGGDTALKAFAKVLTDVCRRSDTVARYGGEEFAIILPNTGAEEAGFLAERVRASLKGSEYGRNGLTSSFGCAEVSAGRDAKDRLINQADKALYESKNGGRDRVTVHKD